MSYITNLYPDPSCYKQLATWSDGSGVNVEHIDGHFRYTNTGNNSWSISDWNSWRELMRLGRVVVIAYTATSGLSVAVESGMTQFDVGGHGRVRGRRLADRPTTPPPVPLVHRQFDATQLTHSTDPRRRRMPT